MNMTTAHWDAAYNAVSQHPVLGKNTRCAVWIETIGEAVLAVGEQPQPDRKHDVKRLRCYSYAVSMAAALQLQAQAYRAYALTASLDPNAAEERRRQQVDHFADLSAKYDGMSADYLKMENPSE